MVDPRTGEIIKGHVSLGSLRVRQDYLIAEGLLRPYAKGNESALMEEMAIKRLRQLSAHEVGHTIGLSHNFISSARNRKSVMDYPHPLIKFQRTTLTFLTHMIMELEIGISLQSIGDIGSLIQTKSFT